MIGASINKKEIEKFVRDGLIQSISLLFDAAGTINIFEQIDAKKEKNEPYLILFLGINGTGKTTTLAKLAYLLQQKKYSVVVAAGDTFRAGAIEQLREHTNRLSLKLVAQNYNSDPAAVARDAVLYAKSHKVNCVLIDTAGRMQTSKNLMEQIEKITKVVKPDLKLFVGDSLAGNDTVNQAREFYEHTNFDGSILTKSDADARGGAALSIVTITSTPVLYVGVGQEYPDLKPFDKGTFLETVFGSISDVSSKEQHAKTIEPTPEPEVKITTEDPFEGIADSDISNYVDLYDIPPPETNEEAKTMASKIRQWISQGRPKPGEEPQDVYTENKDESIGKEKPKKKRGLFGFLEK